jgi:hypothetical protein
MLNTALAPDPASNECWLASLLPLFRVGQTVWLKWPNERKKHYVGEGDIYHPIKRELVVTGWKPRASGDQRELYCLVRDRAGTVHEILQDDLIAGGPSGNTDLWGLKD